MAKVQRYEEDNLCNVLSTMLEQHCMEYCFNIFCSMLARKFIYELRDNHEQEPTLTVTSLILCRSYILEVFIG